MPLIEEDSSDAVSTKDGVLHEESFHEMQQGLSGNDAAHDVEAAPVAEDTGILSTLNIVNWWQVSHHPGGRHQAGGC